MTPTEVAAFYASTALGVADVDYTPVGGAKKTIPAFFDFIREDGYRGADTFGTTAHLRIQAQGDDGIIQVQAGDLVEPADGTDWQVTDAHKTLDGQEWICVIGKKN